MLEIIILILCFNNSDAVTAFFGQSKELLCIYTAQSYRWERIVTGGVMFLHNGLKYQTFGKKLTIKNIEWSDAGSYRCINNDMDPEPTIKLTVEVSAKFGTQITLQCDNYASYNNWYKKINNKFQAINYLDQKYYNVHSELLQITSLNFDDSGIYQCRMYINGWKNGQEQTLTVTGMPDVSIPQQTYYIKRGEQGTLICSVHPKIKPKVTSVWWSKYPVGAPPTSIQSNPTKYGGGNLQTPSLTIKSCSDTDTGKYVCIARNDDGTGQAETQLITGDEPKIITSNRNVSAQIHKETILDVSVQANPALERVKWYKNGRYIDVLNEERYTDGSTSMPSLTIKYLVENDYGTYKCQVQNVFGTSSIEIHLITWSNPTVSLNGDNSIAFGETAIIRGKVKSMPSPNSITWKRIIGNSAVDIDVRNTIKYEITASSTDPVLSIKNIQQTDKGTYVCVVSNMYANGSGTIDIVVGEKAKTTIPVPYYVTKVGKNVTLECIIKTNSSNSNLHWYKGANVIDTFQSMKYSGGSIKNPSLTITNTVERDADTYKCKLKNAFGDSEDSVELKVLSANVKFPLTIIRRANESVHLICETSGGRSVMWRRNGKLFDTSNSLLYSGGTKDIPSLTISKVTRYHAGNYTCETSYDNVTAVSSGFLQLNIQDIPFVHPAQNNIQAITGSTIQLRCNHESYKKPLSVFWKKDGEQLDVTRSKYNGSTINVPSLFIFNVEKTDSGKYVCGVRNDIGTGYSSEMQLMVKDSEETNSAVAPVIGGVVGAILVLVIVLLIVMVLKRRRPRKKEQSKKKVNKKTTSTEQATNYKPDTNDKGEMYVSIGPLSSTDTDEDVTPTSILMKPNSDLNVKTNSAKQKKPYTLDVMKQMSDVDTNLDHGNNDSTYYNIESIITSIRVTELKDYIFRRQLKDELEEEYKKIPYGVQHPTTKAQQKDNMPKNRFKTTFPYDHTRVVLESGNGMSSDYINANYVDGFENEKCYIASQGPVKHTINDHWRMIWQNNTRKIIMLTNLVEGPKTKCEKYWPEGGKSMTCGNLILTLLTEKERAAYITREIQVEDKKTKEKRCIIQYHFTAWPDHGTPDPMYLVLFHKHVISDYTSTENNGPILVHCSAGIGRTGTYIGLDALYKEGRTTGFVDVVNFVKKMRYSRMNMVQTAGQYVCLHYALLEALTMKDTNVGKEEFGTIWQKIVSDKSPVNRQRLHEEFKMLEAKKSEHGQAKYVAAKSPENVNKNRNKSIIPADNNRLFLTSYEKGRTDYINAVQAPSYTKFIGYLTTQLPLPDTKVDFWTMVRDHNSSTIVVFLNDPAEAELVYSTSKDSFTCGKYNVTISNRGKEDMDITSCKVVLSKKDDKPRDIALYLAVIKGLPDPQVLCKLVTLISTRVSMSNDPVTVVSGDGAKNCGVFCTFANAVSSMTIDNNANIFQLARLLQLRRPEFFADFNEYRLCYEALNLYLESSSVYANF